MKRIPLAAAAAATMALLALGACSNSPAAPSETGVCWLLATPKQGPSKFNKIAENIADMEHCAAQIELVRRNFRSLGSTRQEYIGAYQGNYLFSETDGIYTGAKLDGIRYPFLVRSGNQLIAPGAIVEGTSAPPGTTEMK